MDIQERLLNNLDIIDKSIAKAGLSLVSISLLYLAFYYGISKEIKIPLIDLTLKKDYPYYIGIPIISLLSQYILICSFGTIQIERKLKEEKYKSTNPVLRYPTFFSLIFIMGTSSKNSRQKLLYVFHLLSVIFFYFLLPLFTCFNIFKWLIQNDANWVVFSTNTFFLSIIAIEIILFLIAFLHKLVKDTKQKI